MPWWRKQKDRGVKNIVNKEILDKLPIYAPQKKMKEKPFERLIRLENKRFAVCWCWSPTALLGQESCFRNADNSITRLASPSRLLSALPSLLVQGADEEG